MYFKMMKLCLLMLVANMSISQKFKEEDPNVSCGHRLYFSNVNWYTAYKICEEEKKTLALPESDIFTFKSTLEHLIKDRLDAGFTNYRMSKKPNVEVWIGAFLHTSTNESMNSLCKPLNIDLVPDKSQKRDDILCIYFDLSTTKFQAERCDNNNKSFFCYNFKNGKFMYWPHPPMYFPDKPLSKWCPDLQERIETRKKNLTIHKKETNKYQRTLISAPDDRPTSKYMGVTGALVISLVAGIIVCIDLMNFCKIFKPVRVKVE
uniref:C-type lectin domain-containing protein n=1 Tax=Magallana gigas TaxID=29159 RepID=A0A8W8JA55_MAGGI